MLNRIRKVTGTPWDIFAVSIGCGAVRSEPMGLALAGHKTGDTITYAMVAVNFLA
jgi:hypothetical protein